MIVIIAMEVLLPIHQGAFHSMMFFGIIVECF